MTDNNSSSSDNTPSSSTSNNNNEVKYNKGSLFRSVLSYYYQAHQQVRYLLPYSSTFGASQITEQIYLGDINDAMNVPELKNHKITNIVTCVKSLEPFYPNEGFKYLNLHLYDMSDEQIDHTFNESFKYIDNSINNNENILIHCMKGKSRSASILIAYLMRKNQWDYFHTLNYVKQKRNIVQPNTGFELQLLHYQNLLKNNNYYLNQTNENENQTNESN